LLLIEKPKQTQQDQETETEREGMKELLLSWFLLRFPFHKSIHRKWKKEMKIKCRN